METIYILIAGMILAAAGIVGAWIRTWRKIGRLKEDIKNIEKEIDRI